MIARRKQLLLSGKVLPRGYLGINGYEFNGGTYFDTGELPTEDMRIEADFTTEAVTLQTFFGSRIGLNVRNYSFAVREGVFYCASNTSLLSTGVPAEQGRYNVVYTVYGATLNGTEYRHPETDFVANTSTVYIGACHQRLITFDLAQYLLHSFRYYKGNVLLHDYIPCVRIEDGCTGLYDGVNKCFIEPKQYS